MTDNSDVYDHIMAVDDVILLRSLAVHVSSVEQVALLRETEVAEQWADEDKIMEQLARRAVHASIICSELTSLITSSVKSGGQQCVVRTSEEVHNFLARVAHSPLVAASAAGIQDAVEDADPVTLEDYERRVVRIQRVLDATKPRNELQAPAPVEGIPTGGKKPESFSLEARDGTFEVRGPQGGQ